MTKLPRILISLPPDIERAINEIKAAPENEYTPKSKIVCALIRRGIKADLSDYLMADTSTYQPIRTDIGL